MAETLNEILPQKRRLSLLNIDHLVKETEVSQHRDTVSLPPGSEFCLVDSSEGDMHFKPVDELAVVDESNV